MKIWWLRALVALILGTLVSAPASAAWKRAESDNFIVYSQASDSALREQSALLEDYHDFLRRVTGVTEPDAANKLSIYMVRSPAQLRSIRDMPAGIAGVYMATPAGIAAVVDESAPGQGQEILLHEVAHHFMKQYRPLAYPAWYVEGFAEYFSTASFKKDSIELGRPSGGRAFALVEGKWLPLERILFGQVPTDREGMSAFYAQSWLLAHYLLRNEQQRPRFDAYLRAAVKGEDQRKAFAASFPMPIPDLERELRAYTRRGMTYTKYNRPSAAAPPSIGITRLPASADDLLLLRATMEVGPPDEAALLAKVREAAARHDDDFSRRVLAQAESLHGDPARADVLLERLLAASPNDPEALYFKGMRHLRTARVANAQSEASFKIARNAFAMAHKGNPDHWQTLLRYAEALQVTDSFVSDNTINILLLARQLAPQAVEATMNAAQLLIERKRWDEAEALLLPLTGDPHNQVLADAAKRMLARIKAQKARAGNAGEQEDEPVPGSSEE